MSNNAIMLELKEIKKKIDLHGIVSFTERELDILAYLVDNEIRWGCLDFK